MTYALAKSIVGVGILTAALAAALAMLALTGKPQTHTPPEKLRRLHRIAGRTFGLLLLGNSLAGFLHYLRFGGGLSFRGILHVYAALALSAIFLLKFGIVKIYRQHLRIAPGLGMTLVALTLVIVLASAALVLLGAVPAAPSFAKPASVAGSAPLPGDSEAGSRIFARLCAACHFADSIDPKVGPGLKNLFGRPLPASGLPATAENVRRQLRAPLGKMPAFPALGGRDGDDLLAYLRTL